MNQMVLGFEDQVQQKENAMQASQNQQNVAKGNAQVAFFSRKEDKEPAIEIYRSTSPNPRAPMFSGKVGEKRVAMFLRHGARGPFLGLVGDKIEGTNQYENLGTANVITGKTGSPRLVMRMGDDRLFCSVSKNLDNEMLVRLGLDENIQQQKREAAESEQPAAPVAEDASSAAQRQLDELVGA
jgi:hypothetical protein